LAPLYDEAEKGQADMLHLQGDEWAFLRFQRRRRSWFRHRERPRTRDTVEFYGGDLAPFVNGRLRAAFGSIWFVGGGVVCAECLRLGLADEVRYSILPILIGDGIKFFEKLDGDVALHLAEVKAYKSGLAGLRYKVRR
jgi:dihydrofolate reductase